MKPATTGLLFFLISLYVYTFLSLELFVLAPLAYPGGRLVTGMVVSVVLAILTAWFVYKYERG